jgi:REP element-mobilizing transposase RayT
LAADGALSQHARKSLPGKKVEEYLDSGYGSCALADAAVARIVEQSLLHFDGERYRLLAWVVMPNHVHVVLKTWPHWRHGRVVHSWKSYSAKRINEHLGLKGRLWQPEYHDRLVLSEKQLQRVLDYVEWNPVKAGLCARPEEWPWGSAACRCR